MPRIQITPEQVREAAHQFEQSSSDSQDMILRLNTQIRGMEVDWAGLTKESFFADYQQWETSMKQHVELLAKIGQQLTVIAERFEAADRPV